MKDSYSFDLYDDGLAAPTQAPRGVHEDLRPAGAALRDRLGDVGGDGRLGVARSSWPSPRRRGHLRPLHQAATRRTSRRSSRPRRPRSRSTACPPRMCTTRQARRRSRRWSPSSTPPALGRTVHRRRHAQERAGQDPPPGADGWELLAVGVPGDREVDMKRLEAPVAPAEVALLDEADFAAHPFLVKGYIGPGALAAERCALPRRPADRHRHGLGDRRRQGRPPRRRPRRGPRLHRRTARSRPPRCAPATRRPTARACWRPRAASRSGTSSSSAASTPTPSRSTRSARTASRSGSPWAPTASASPALVAAIAEQSHDEHGPGLAALGRAVRRAPRRRRQGRRDPRGRRALAAELDAAGLRVLLDDRRPRRG